MKAVGTWIAFGECLSAIFLPSFLPSVYFFAERSPPFLFYSPLVERERAVFSVPYGTAPLLLLSPQTFRIRILTIFREQPIGWFNSPPLYSISKNHRNEKKLRFVEWNFSCSLGILSPLYVSCDRSAGRTDTAPPSVRAADSNSTLRRAAPSLTHGGKTIERSQTFEFHESIRRERNRWKEEDLSFSKSQVHFINSGYTRKEESGEEGGV